MAVKSNLCVVETVIAAGYLRCGCFAIQRNVGDGINVSATFFLSIIFGPRFFVNYDYQNYHYYYYYFPRLLEQQESTFSGLPLFVLLLSNAEKLWK